MRKLLILMLVLGMASWAVAVPIITVPGTVTVGDTFNVTISGTAAEASGDGPGTPNNPMGGWSGILGLGYPTYTSYPLGVANPYISFVSMTPVATTAAGGMQATGSNNYGAAKFTAGSASPWGETTDVDAGLWFTYTLSADAVGTTSVDEVNPGYPYNVRTSYAIEIVPEPMTMVLLGLGGLLLRRRK